LFNRRPILKPLPSVMNMLRYQRRTSIPITWDQRDMLLKFPNERRKYKKLSVWVTLIRLKTLKKEL
jgi:hypothetical protein